MSDVGLWDTDEAARYLGVSVFTLRHWIVDRRMPHIRLGRCVRFDQRDLDGFIASRRVTEESADAVAVEAL